MYLNPTKSGSWSARKECVMNKFFAAIKRAPKRTAVLSAVVAAVLVPAGLLAWGPSRTTFTKANPAPYVTFNSITDNTVVGDERQFVGARDASITQDSNWGKDVTVQPGKEYKVRVYVHNNAASNLNLKAINTRVSASVPTTTGTNVGISTFVSADNAQPQKVWADVNFKSANGQKFNLAYVPGSAEIYNNGYAKGGNGQPLPDSIVTAAGAQIGYESANGEVPGCFEYANYVYFTVKPQFEKSPSFEVNKTASKSGENKWSENVQMNAGDKVDYRIQYKNTGDIQNDNVVIKDVLPKGVTYVAGSTKLYSNAPGYANGKTLNDDITKAGGINIGSFSAGASGFVVFTATVGKENLICGTNTLVNKAMATTDYGTKEDTTNVTVNKECAPGTINVCDLTTKQIISIEESKFDSTKHSKNTADCVETPVTALPETGISGTAIFAGLGLATAGLGYALTSARIRKLFIG